MKPTQLTELLSNIRATFVSFFSILMFVALGVGIFLGILWSAPALYRAMDAQFAADTFHHFQVTYPYGFTADAIDELRATEGVEDAEGIYTAIAQARYEGVAGNVKAQSVPERIDTLEVLEGALPQGESEVAILELFAEESGLSVGDAIELTAQDDAQDVLAGERFTVSGIVRSAEYTSADAAGYGQSGTGSGKLDGVVYLPVAAFDAQAFNDAFPVVNVRASGVDDLSTFDSGYAQATSATKERLVAAAERLADVRFAGLQSEAQEQIDEAQAQVDDGAAQIADGQEQIEAAEQELADAKAQLADGEEQIAEARQQIEDGEAELANAQEMISSGGAGAAGGVGGAGAAGGVGAAGAAGVAAGATGAGAQAAGGGQMAQLAQMQAELEQKSQELEDGKAELAAREAEIEEARTQIADGEAELASKRDELASAQADLESARVDLADAQEALDAMRAFAPSVAPRSYNGGVIQADTLGGVTTRLSLSMALLFVVVGLLVCYSAVSRIVHEQVTQIGTKKALGLRRREITTSFLGYSGIAVIAGAITGIIVGIIAVEGIINPVIGGRFSIDAYGPYFNVPQALAITALELVLILATTWLACRNVLKRQAVDLLRGEEPPAAKQRFFEKWAVWQKLPLFTQTVVNNCMNDKRRVFSTVVGVAGCTALIVCAITLNDDVLESYDRQYRNVYGFDAIAYVDTQAEGAVDSVQASLQEGGATTVPVKRSTLASIDESDGRSALQVIVPADAEAFAQLYRMNVTAGEAYRADAQGAWVTQAYAEHKGAHVGDELRILDASGDEHEVPILGFYEYWLTRSEAIMPPAYYESEFESAPEPNAILVDTGITATSDVERAVSGTDGFLQLVDDRSDQRTNFDQFASVSRTVVFVYLALAVLMAIVVLLNLNVMFIEEKKRDLIVLMINGFSVKDAKRYITSDTVVLTAIGIVCGVVLGCAIGALTVSSVEPQNAVFVKDIDWIAVAAGVVGTAVLAWAMNRIALRRIPRFALTDINKM